MKNENQSPEDYFLKYAMPCAFLVRELGEISDNELKEIETAAFEDKTVSKERLKKIFYRAFEKMEKHSKDWDVPTIKKYFHELHNIEIDNKEGYYASCDEMNRELSKVRVAEIIDKKDQTYVIVYQGEDGEKKRNVFTKLLPNAKIGDKVYIHFFFAIEKAD
ncbi:HypC/HybG/HupF family hydrogenase formation chaperone [Candidatus Woesearchaeota archaeon]|nr:HypC/HybG/HupF family hydrogenase formation chaperone [Candidatus Woesearchaeota archaeon]